MSFINEAKRQDRAEGLEEGRQEGLQTGRLEGESRLLRKMIQVKVVAIPTWADG